jgi:hypothetical protein
MLRRSYLPIWEGMVMVRLEVEKVARIEGGFVLVPVAGLMVAWWSCRSSLLGIGDFRAWLACREMVARRSASPEGLGASYGFPELARLLGVTTRRARASVLRLVTVGLIEWSDSAIRFVDPRVEMTEPVEDLDAIGGGKGSIAIPRRLLRYLVAGARPAMIATALGVLLRCLSRRRGGFDGRGRIKTSWVARTFGVDDRRVKQARKELVALGWIGAETSGQRAENRWGRAYRINLAWEPPFKVRTELWSAAPTASPPEAGGRSLPPLPTDDRRATATPSVDPEPLPERENDQEPAGGPAGFSIEGSGEGSKPLTAPTLDDVRLEDLKDTGRLLDLHCQAVAKEMVTTCEADRLRFVGAAEHALAIGKVNPAGLFVWLARGRCWRYLTQADEDSARRRLRLHDLGKQRVSALATPFSTSRPIDSGLSDDARIVRKVRAACIRAGVFRDPWPAFSARNPCWDRGRWDLALAELGLSPG